MEDKPVGIILQVTKYVRCYFFYKKPVCCKKFERFEFSRKILFVTGKILFVTGKILFVTGKILFVTGKILFVTGKILFFTGKILFVTVNNLFSLTTIHNTHILSP